MDFSKAFRLNGFKKGNAGFTLIELAMVLVIIGLILAAVVKATDLIADAQITDFIANPVQKTEIDAIAYYTRTGEFANWNSSNNTGALYSMWQAGIKDVINIRNPFIADGNIFAMALGVISVKDSDNTTNNYPVIAIYPAPYAASSGTDSCALNSSPWSKSEIDYAIHLKAVIDGNQNWSTGAVRFWSDGSGDNSGVSVNWQLQTEAGGNLQTTVCDGYINGPMSQTIYQYFTATPNTVLGQQGSTAPLVYFYYKTPY